VPLNVEVTAGQTHDSTCFESVIDGIKVPQPLGRPRTRPTRVAGDKGYSCRRIRQWLADHGMKAVIPSNRSRKRIIRHDKTLYRERNRIERCFNKLKHFRRLATRYDRRACHFLAFLCLAAAMLWMR